MRARTLLPVVLLLFAPVVASAAPQARAQVEPAAAQTVRTPPSQPPLTPRPLAPYRMRDHCPFEFGCSFGAWQACEPLAVRPTPDFDAPVRYHLAAMEHFRALRADLVLTRLGRARVEYPMDSDPDRDWPSFPVGTEVVVFKVYPEAGYGIWTDGRAWDVEGFWNEPPSPRWPGRMLQRPEMTWWVEIESLDGQRGWLGLRNTLTDMDGIAFDEVIRMNDRPVTEDDPACAELLRWREQG